MKIHVTLGMKRLQEGPWSECKALTQSTCCIFYFSEIERFQFVSISYRVILPVLYHATPYDGFDGLL
jgi:hypothetical protein